MGQGGRRNFSSSSHQKLRMFKAAMDLNDASSASCSNGGYIQHYVSKLDTLAGIAIKYGVEVADIKRLNGLTTDLQMYARKSLRIPLHGKHPPSDQSLTSAGPSSSRGSRPRLGKHSCPTVVLPSGSEASPAGKRKVNSAMGLLRGYYGLAGQPRTSSEGTEMEVYKENNGDQSEDEPFTPRENKLKASSEEDLTGTSTFNNMVTMARDFVVGEFEKAAAVRRRPKTDDLAGQSSASKSSIPRPKSSSSRFGVEVEVDCPTVRAVVFNSARDSGSGGGSGGKGLLSGSVVEELIFKLKKSPSTSTLQDEKQAPIHRNGSKGDLAVLNGPGIPLLESFTRRSKTALD